MQDARIMFVCRLWVFERILPDTTSDSLRNCVNCTLYYDMNLFVIVSR